MFGLERRGWRGSEWLRGLSPCFGCGGVGGVVGDWTRVWRGGWGGVMSV